MVQIGTIKIAIPGGKMYPKEVCDFDKTLLDKNFIYVKYEDKVNEAGGKRKKISKTEKLFFNTRKYIPATVVVPIYDIAYNYWKSGEVPSFSNIKEWKKFNTQQRVLMHIEEIAKAHNGTLLDWSVNND